MSSRTLPPEVRAALEQCIGCHDQCMSVSMEVVASGRQELVMSRVASSVRSALGGTQAWSEFFAETLFLSLDQGAQQRACVVIDGSQDPRVFLRWARREALAAGYQPAFLADFATHLAGSGHSPSVEGPQTSPTSPVLITDRVTGALNAEAIEDATRVLSLVGEPPAVLRLGSTGTVENFLGMQSESDIAISSATARLQGAFMEARLVAVDPAVVYAARFLWPAVGWSQPVSHLAEVLDEWQWEPSTNAAPLPTVTINDTGMLSRDLGVSQQVRSVLRRCGYDVREAVTNGVHARDDGPMLPYPDQGARRSIARSRAEELVGTGADMIVTVAPWSHENLRAVSPIPVMDFASAVAIAAGVRSYDSLVSAGGRGAR